MVRNLSFVIAILVSLSGIGIPTLPRADIKPIDRDARPIISGRLAAYNPQLGAVKADRIATAVVRCAQTHPELSANLVLAVMFVESEARPHAVSPKGAIGLMQVMPYTFANLGLPGSLAHLETNVEAGCMILAENVRKHGTEKGVSVYFWGNKVKNSRYLGRVRRILHTFESA